MSPQLLLLSRIMRIVVLLGFATFLVLSDVNWLNMLFAGVCIIGALVTAWQLWASTRKEHHNLHDRTL